MKKHAQLRKYIRWQGTTQAELADQLGISTVALYKKMAGLIPWKIAECYLVLRILELPVDKLIEVFPEEDQIIESI